MLLEQASGLEQCGRLETRYETTLLQLIDCHDYCSTGGNIRLVAGLAKGLPILYNSVVQDIECCEDRVRVSTASTSFEGDTSAQQGSEATPLLQPHSDGGDGVEQRHSCTLSCCCITDFSIVRLGNADRAM